MLIDLHVHTSRGGPDSNLSPQEMIAEAKRLGLDAICVTEHGGGWDRWDFERFAKEQDILVFRGMEIDTDMGHVAVFGLDGYVSGIHKVHTLRKVADDAGAFLVSLHPFRRLFEKPPLNKSLLFKGPVSLEEAIKHPVWELVDAVEVLNGANSERENTFAYQVAQKLGLPGSGGSDAHSKHGFGSNITYFEQRITSQDELLAELRSRRFRAARGLIQGKLEFFQPA